MSSLYERRYTKARWSGRPVFLNCPFDDEYRSLFEAIVFTIHLCGFSCRCALEAVRKFLSDYASEDAKISGAEQDSGFMAGIYDGLTRTPGLCQTRQRVDDLQGISQLC
jgi:hypothetical protein